MTRTCPKHGLPCRGSYDVGKGLGDGAGNPDKRMPSIFACIYKVLEQSASKSFKYQWFFNGFAQLCFKINGFTMVLAVGPINYASKFPKQGLPCRGSYDVGKGLGSPAGNPDKIMPSIFACIY